jgi:hypothetical protein
MIKAVIDSVIVARLRSEGHARERRAGRRLSGRCPPAACLLLATWSVIAAAAPPPAIDPGLGSGAVRLREFVCPRGFPTQSCHASTIVEATGGGLVAAWFGGYGKAFIALAGLGVMLGFARFLFKRGIFLRL